MQCKTCNASLQKMCSRGRVVKAMDSKSIGVSPHRFESCRLRNIFFLDFSSFLCSETVNASTMPSDPNRSILSRLGSSVTICGRFGVFLRPMIRKPGRHRLSVYPGKLGKAKDAANSSRNSFLCEGEPQQLLRPESAVLSRSDRD